MAILKHDEDFKKTGVNPEEANGVNMEQPTTSNSFASNHSDYMSLLKGGLTYSGGITTSLQELKEAADKIIESRQSVAKGVKVLVIDNNIVKQSYYSLLVFYKNYADRKLTRYTIMLLAKSNRRSLTAKETLSKTVAAMNGNTAAKEELFTYTDAIDDVLYGIIHDTIRKNDTEIGGDDWKYQSLDGNIVPYDTEPIKVIENVTINAINSFTINELQEKGIGLNIAKLKSAVGNTSLFKYNLESRPEGIIIDSLGNAIKADFTATIRMVNPVKYGPRTINTYNRDETLVTTSGYVTGIPSFITRMDPVTRQAVQSAVVIPHIVITNIKTDIPDVASMLLGVAAGSLVGSRKQYIKVIMDCLTKDRNPGYYNVITKTALNKNGVAEPIMDLLPGNNKWSDAERAQAINSLMDSEPIVSIDITPFGEGYQQLVPLDLCNVDSRARAELEAGLKTLTNGAIDGYKNNIVFSKNQIPYGQYSASKGKGVRDIRDLELAVLLKYVFESGGDDTAINMFIGSVVPNNSRSFDEKMELLANILPEAYIDGKTNRLTFDPMFIKTLIDALERAGLVTDVDSMFNIATSGYNLDMLSPYANMTLASDFGNNGIFRILNQGANDPRTFNTFGYNVNRF